MDAADKILEYGGPRTSRRRRRWHVVASLLMVLQALWALPGLLLIMVAACGGGGGSGIVFAGFGACLPALIAVAGSIRLLRSWRDRSDTELVMFLLCVLLSAPWFAYIGYICWFDMTHNPDCP